MNLPSYPSPALAARDMHSFEGELVATPYRIIRRDYSRHFREITNGRQLRACLRAGKFAWPGGYACFFLTSDGAILSFKAVRAELQQVIWAIRHKQDTGWRVVGLDTTANVDLEEGSPMQCDHTGKEIE